MKFGGMNVFLLVGICSLYSVSGHINGANGKNEEILDSIKATVDNIYHKLQSGNNINEIKELLQIDNTLKKLDKQQETILAKFQDNLGRSGSSNNEIQIIENRLESMETEIVSNVKGGIRKMAEMEKQTSNLKNDLDKKLGKLSNIMTSVYEMNQRYGTSLVTPMTPTNNKKESPVITDDKLENMNNFLEEQFNHLGQQIAESVQVMKIELRRDLNTLETSISNMFEACDDLKPEMETVKNQCEKMTPPLGRTGALASGQLGADAVNKITEEVVRNLTRTQREVTDRLENKLKDLETKMSQNQPSKPETNRADKAIVTGVSSQSVQVKPAHRPQPPSAQNPPSVNPQPSECKKITTNKLPKNCWELLKLGANCDGVYVVYPEKKRATYAFCDMTDNGGGWTVLMRRGDYGPHRENFDRSWLDYKNGFGDKMGEFWLGNENIHQLSHQLEVVLRVTLEDFKGNRTFFDYEPFSVASEGMNYRLHVGRISDPKKSYHGYSLRHHNMRPFSTFDKNNDHQSSNQAAKFKGGWWYNRGHYALLTAPFMKPETRQQKWEGMQWHAWNGPDLIKTAEMKIRPKYHNV